MTSEGSSGWFIEIDGESAADRRIRYRRESAKRYKSDPAKAEKRRENKRLYHARRQQDESRRLAELERAKLKREELPAARKAEMAEASRSRSLVYHAANRTRILDKWAQSTYWRDWRAANPGKTRAYYARRKAAVKRATPAWVDNAEIEAIYAECVRITAETGILHEVDHIVPILGRNVCGLHIPLNLQILTRADNRAKSNRFNDGAASENRIDSANG